MTDNDRKPFQPDRNTDQAPATELDWNHEASEVYEFLAEMVEELSGVNMDYPQYKAVQALFEEADADLRKARAVAEFARSDDRFLPMLRVLVVDLAHIAAHIHPIYVG